MRAHVYAFLVKEIIAEEAREGRFSAGVEAALQAIGVFDPAERAREKQASRDRDAADLASGRKSAEQLNRENGGAFAFPRVRIHHKSGGKIR